jgi:hypothetical protein
MAQKQTTQKKHLIFWLADKEKSLINFVKKNEDYIKGTALMLICATLFYFSMWIFY